MSLDNAIILAGLVVALISNLLNRIKLGKVHKEVKSGNGDETTGYAVTKLVRDNEYMIGQLHQLEALREDQQELTKLVAAHMSDEHGPSQFPSRKRTTQRRTKGS